MIDIFRILARQAIFYRLAGRYDNPIYPPSQGLGIGPQPVPEFIDPRFRENKPKRAYSVIENERFGLVFAKTGSMISDTGACLPAHRSVSISLAIFLPKPVIKSKKAVREKNAPITDPVILLLVSLMPVTY